MAGEIGFGAAFGYSDTLNGTYTDFSYVVDIVPPQVTATRVDRSHHGMSNPRKEKGAGLGDSGEAEITLLFDKAQEDTIRTLHRQDKYFRIKYPLVGAETTPSMLKCAGHIADIGAAVPIDDKMTCKIKVVWSGKETFTQGS